MTLKPVYGTGGGKSKGVADCREQGAFDTMNADMPCIEEALS